MASEVDERSHCTWFLAISPDDPGGPLTPERLRTLRWRAAEDHHAPHAQPLLDALDEVEQLRAAMAEHEADAALVARVLRSVPWLGAWPGVLWEWPPRWLRDAVDTGRADALQADRAAVTSTANLGGEPTVPWLPGTPWYRHSAPPGAHDEAAYQSARRVLARCEGRSP